jgi:hypothetical protein
VVFRTCGGIIVDDVTGQDFQALDDDALLQWIEDAAAEHQSSVVIRAVGDQTQVSIVTTGHRPTHDWYARLNDVETSTIDVTKDSRRVALEETARLLAALGWAPALPEITHMPFVATPDGEWSSETPGRPPIPHIDGGLFDQSGESAPNVLQNWVFPLVAITFDSPGRPPSAAQALGTAFSVGPGLLVTARHVIEPILHKGQIPPNVFLTAGFISIYREVSGALPIIQASMTRESQDFAVLQFHPDHPVFRQPYPVVSKRLSVKLPVVGERLMAYGYPDFKACINEKGEVDANAILRAAPGTVREVRVEGTSTVSGWPMIRSNNRFPNGMSGGPVLAQDGTVCGVVSSGDDTPLDGKEPAGYVSLLPPLFGIDVPDPPPDGKLVTFLELAQQGRVKTDDSLKLLTYVKTEDGPGRLSWQFDK